MPIHPVSNRPAATPSPARSTSARSTQPHLRAYATRATDVATASAAAALLAVLPATAEAPTAAPAAAATPAVAAPADPAAGLSPLVLEQAAAVPAAPAVPAPVVRTHVVTAAVQAPAAASAPAAAPAGASIVELALSKVGSPYRWGATGPSSFDCSGLVNWAFEQAGMDVPRTSRALSQAGAAVSRDELQPGDLVFFYSPVSHVGIYIGNGQMVHASTSGKPVAVSDIDGRPFNSARRL